MASSLADRLDKIRSSPKLENQRQTNIILSAIEETLRDQRSALTPTSYFSALLSLLRHHVSSSGITVNEEVASAIVYLLDLVAADVPAPLVRTKFSDISSVLAPVLGSVDAKAPLLRSAIGCLESVLVAQDSIGWALPADGPSPRRAMAGLVTVAADHRPKVRKRAVDAVAKVLDTIVPGPALDHPAARMCAGAAMTAVAEGLDKAPKRRRTVGSGGGDSDASLMHGLQLVKAIATTGRGWPTADLAGLSELVLAVAAAGPSQHATVAAFEVFDALLDGIGRDGAEAKLGPLLGSVMALQPTGTERTLVPAWLALVARAHVVAAKAASDETFASLPAVFALVTSILATESAPVRTAAVECAARLLEECVPATAVVKPTQAHREIITQIGSTAANLLTAQFQHAWLDVFTVLESVFDTFRWSAPANLGPVVRAVGEIRTRNAGFVDVTAADRLLARAVAALGPRTVLELVPLNLTGEGQGRAWMLSVLSRGVANTELGHFKSDLVPLAEKLASESTRLAEAAASSGPAGQVGPIAMQAKVLEAAALQIWALLPGYCTLPIDVTEFAGPFAEAVAGMMYTHIAVRSDIARALRALVQTNQAVAGGDEEEEIDEEDDEALLSQWRVSQKQARANIAHLAGLAPQLLAALFNVYSETLPSARGLLLQAIDAWLSIAAPEELEATFSRLSGLLPAAIEELASTAAGPSAGSNGGRDRMPPAAHTLLDLAVAMAPYLSAGTLAKLIATVPGLLASSDGSIQKKTYKLVPRLGSTKAVMLSGMVGQVCDLVANAPPCAPSARRDRLAAIMTLIPILPDDNLAFIAAVVPETVLATKEVNEKARAGAFDLIVSFGRRMQAGGTVARPVPVGGDQNAESNSVSASIDEFVTMVSAGLAGGSPHGIAATVNALARILWQFSDDMATSTRDELVETVTLFLGSKSREIARAVLGFVKIVVLTLPVEYVAARLPIFVPGIVGWGKEHRERLKAKTRHLLERLVRRFGADLVEAACPESDRRLVTNIRKRSDRADKKKSDGDRPGQDDDEDGEDNDKPKKHFESAFDEVLHGSDSEQDQSDEEDEDDSAGRGLRGKASKATTHILELEGEPLDLLARDSFGKFSSRRSISTGGQGQESSNKKQRVRTGPDGRLILSDKLGAENGDGTTDPDGDDVMADQDDLAGMDAYIAAIRGPDAARRGAKGKLKFRSGQTKENRQMAREENERDYDRDVDETGGRKPRFGSGRGGGRGRDGRRGGRPSSGPRGRGDQGRGRSDGRRGSSSGPGRSDRGRAGRGGSNSGGRNKTVGGRIVKA